VSHEEGEAKVLAPCLSSFLPQLADGLENGTIGYSTAGNVANSWLMRDREFWMSGHGCPRSEARSCVENQRAAADPS
jgi:hypothetical protein